MESEIGRIKAEIELQSAAARYALYSSSYGASKHSFISSKMERMGELHDQLAKKEGKKRAMRFLIRAIDG